MLHQYHSVDPHSTFFLKVKPLVMHASCCTICWATSDKVRIMDKSGAVSYYPDSPEEIDFVAVYKS